MRPGVSPALERKRRSRAKSRAQASGPSRQPPRQKEAVSPAERKRRSRARDGVKTREAEARKRSRAREGVKTREAEARKRRNCQTNEKKEEVKATERERKRRSRARPAVKAGEAAARKRSRKLLPVSLKETAKLKRRNDYAKSKEDHNAKRKKRSEKRTPERVETENAAARESMRGLRRARRGIALERAGRFNTSMLWEVPGNDYTLGEFVNFPESAVLLWHANTGCWWEREPKMCIAWLHLYNKLDHARKVEVSADAVNATERKMRGLVALCRESVEDKVSLLRVVREHIKESDRENNKKWQQDERINDPRAAELEWLVTNGLQCGRDCKELREKRKPTPLVDSWARSLIGLKLKVEGGWWEHCQTCDKETEYDSEIVDVDYQVREAEVEEGENDKRYFVVFCEHENRRFPMEYKCVKQYARGVKQEGDKRYELPDKANLRVIDEEFEKLCTDTLEALEKNRDGDNSCECREFVEERIRQLLKSQFVKPGKQRELGQKFLKAQGRGTVSWGEAKVHSDTDLTSIDAPLLTCASCGFRRLHSSLPSGGDDGCFKVENKDVKLLHWAELDDAQRSEHRERMAKPPLSLPVNDKGGQDDFKDFETWRAYSRWPDKKPHELTNDATYPDWMFYKNSNGETDRSNPKYFHLHPELVEEFAGDDGRRDFRARLCRSCYKFSPDGKGKAPVRSVASGVDFGSPNRVGLVRLTPRERQVISPVRHYHCDVIIESNTGRQRELSHSALKGHSVLFDHDCPRVVKKLLSEEYINDSIEIHFVGPDGEYDHLAKKALGSAHVSARPFAVYQWLSVLREVNVMYSDVDALPKFDVSTRRMSPSFEEATELIDKCNKSLVDNATKIATDEKTVKETSVARDDIRGVRVTSGRSEEEPDASNDDLVSLLNRVADQRHTYALPNDI